MEDYMITAAQAREMTDKSDGVKAKIKTIMICIKLAIEEEKSCWDTTIDTRLYDSIKAEMVRMGYKYRIIRIFPETTHVEFSW
jgi:hypothetical protein